MFFEKSNYDSPACEVIQMESYSCFLDISTGDIEPWGEDGEIDFN